jgi:hypothetical protein
MTGIRMAFDHGEAASGVTLLTLFQQFGPQMLSTQVKGHMWLGVPVLV